MRFQTSTSSYEHIGGGNFKLKTMEKKEISIYWLLDKIITKKHTDSELNYIFQQAEAMHKKEIEDAYNESFRLRDKPYSTAVKYYNDTYGGNNE